MKENQSDKGNQKTDSISNQSTTQDGNRKETNPNNPSANQGKRQPSASPAGKQNKDVLVSEEGQTTDRNTRSSKVEGNSKSR